MQPLLGRSQAHLLHQVLPVGADVVHSVLVHSEVRLEGFVLLQQALQWEQPGQLLRAWHRRWAGPQRSRTGGALTGTPVSWGKDDNGYRISWKSSSVKHD